MEETDRYAGIRQYSLAQILAVWAAAALPMAALAWLVAPALKDHFAGAGNVPLFKALNVCLTIGLVWQFVLVATLAWHEQRTFRWSTCAAKPAHPAHRRQDLAAPDPTDPRDPRRVDAAAGGAEGPRLRRVHRL
jgi:hypothetical protein